MDQSAQPVQPAAQPQPEPQPQPQPSTSSYISNPFQMVGPSARALAFNIGTLFALFGIGLLVALPLFVALILLLVSHGSSTMGLIAGAIGVIDVIALIAYGFIMLPTYLVVYLSSAQRQKITAREAIAKGRKLVGRLLGVSLLTGLAVLGGLILLIVPGIIFAIWFSQSGYVAVSENLGVIDSMKRSKQLVHGRGWEIVGLFSLGSLFAAIPVLGQILDLILGILLMPAGAIRYLQLAQTPTEQRPKVHALNYAVIVLALISGIIASAMRPHTTTTPTYTVPTTPSSNY